MTEPNQQADGILQVSLFYTSRCCFLFLDIVFAAIVQLYSTRRNNIY